MSDVALWAVILTYLGIVWGPAPLVMFCIAFGYVAFIAWPYRGDRHD